jgi:hypothetical protein
VLNAKLINFTVSLYTHVPSAWYTSPRLPPLHYTVQDIIKKKDDP